MIAVPKLWPGATVACLGGGPSLTGADVDACRGRLRVVAVNDAYRLAPWAEVLYACDDRWWRWQHQLRRDEIAAFAGLRYSIDPRAKRWPGVQVLRNTGADGLEIAPTGLRHGRNSGYQAINLAVHLGASRIVLLGYDMQRSGGKSHWFGEHPMPGKSLFVAFREKYASIVKPLRDAGVEVINCSRQTALTAFPQQPLEAVLQQATVAA